MDFYISQTEAENHAVREAACACVAELGIKVWLLTWSTELANVCLRAVTASISPSPSVWEKAKFNPMESQHEWVTGASPVKCLARRHCNTFVRPGAKLAMFGLWVRHTKNKTLSIYWVTVAYLTSYNKFCVALTTTQKFYPWLLFSKSVWDIISVSSWIKIYHLTLAYRQNVNINNSCATFPTTIQDVRVNV